MAYENVANGHKESLKQFLARKGFTDGLLPIYIGKPTGSKQNLGGNSSTSQEVKKPRPEEMLWIWNSQVCHLATMWSFFPIVIPILGSCKGYVLVMNITALIGL